MDVDVVKKLYLQKYGKQTQDIETLYLFWVSMQSNTSDGTSNPDNSQLSAATGQNPASTVSGKDPVNIVNQKNKGNRVSQHAEH